MTTKKRENKSGVPTQKTLDWRWAACFFGLAVGLVGSLVLVVLTPGGQSPETWFVESWLNLWAKKAN